MNPKYPVYIISKGRSATRYTAKSLEKMQVQYHIVIEPQEYDMYAKHIAHEKILVLPFSNLGIGSIPARNWVWEHSMAQGAAKHWILDDNINGFYRYYRNMKVPVASGAIFRAAEEFIDRFQNVPLAGFNYTLFCCRKWLRSPLILNSRIYSCILIQNDLPIRWRGRYNEDTDLSLRVLKSGDCTILFHIFQANKLPTMTVPGGNTEELYQGDGRYRMTQSLIEQHPDVTRMVKKYNRWHHYVDYRAFRQNRPRYKPNTQIQTGINNYGMILQEKNGDVWENVERPEPEGATCKDSLPVQNPMFHS